MRENPVTRVVIKFMIKEYFSDAVGLESNREKDYYCSHYRELLEYGIIN